MCTCRDVMHILCFKWQQEESREDRLEAETGRGEKNQTCVRKREMVLVSTTTNEKIADCARFVPPSFSPHSCSPQAPSSLFFQYNDQLGPPYLVLVDTNFINFSIQHKLDITQAMVDCLCAKCSSEPYHKFQGLIQR